MKTNLQVYQAEQRPLAFELNTGVAADHTSKTSRATSISVSGAAWANGALTKEIVARQMRVTGSVMKVGRGRCLEARRA